MEGLNSTIDQTVTSSIHDTWPSMKHNSTMAAYYHHLLKTQALTPQSEITHLGQGVTVKTQLTVFAL